MTDQALIVLGTIIIFLGLAGFLISGLFIRATKNQAYIRTGYGGEKIILNTGVFALPILHKVLPVSLTTKNIEITQLDDDSVITKDRLRADLVIDFYLNVEANATAVALAAQTLGTRTLNDSELKEFLEGRLIDSLRTAAAEFSMAELHEQPQRFVAKISQLIVGQLVKNGLHLETVSLKSIDQTGKKYFDSDNIFDAEGLSSLTKTTQTGKKICNEIEQETAVEMRRKQLESERLIHEMEREKANSQMSQQKEIEAMKAQQKMDKIQSEFKQQLEEEKAKIMVAQAVKLAEHDKTITLAEKTKEISKTEAEANISLAESVRAEEQVVTARELAKADRQKQIDLIEASTQADREAMSITSRAAAKKKAAQDMAEVTRIQAEGRAQAARIIAEGKKDADKIATEALKTFYETHSNGIRALIDTLSAFSNEKIPVELRLEVLEHIPKIPQKAEPETNRLPIETPVDEDIQPGIVNDIGLASETNLNSDFEFTTNDRNREVKSSKIRTIISDAHKSVLQEAISALNEMSGNPDFLKEAEGAGNAKSTPTVS